MSPVYIANPTYATNKAIEPFAMHPVMAATWFNRCFTGRLGLVTDAKHSDGKVALAAVSPNSHLAKIQYT